MASSAANRRMAVEVSNVYARDLPLYVERNYAANSGAGGTLDGESLYCDASCPFLVRKVTWKVTGGMRLGTGIPAPGYDVLLASLSSPDLDPASASVPAGAAHAVGFSHQASFTSSCPVAPYGNPDGLDNLPMFLTEQFCDSGEFRYSQARRFNGPIRIQLSWRVPAGVGAAAAESAATLKAGIRLRLLFHD